MPMMNRRFSANSPMGLIGRSPVWLGNSFLIGPSGAEAFTRDRAVSSYIAISNRTESNQSPVITAYLGSSWSVKKSTNGIWYENNHQVHSHEQPQTPQPSLAIRYCHPDRAARQSSRTTRYSSIPIQRHMLRLQANNPDQDFPLF